MGFPRSPAHPGNVIREGCLGDELTHSAALRLGFDPDEFEQLVQGRGRITPALALRMQAVGWSNASFWVRLQADLDLDREILRQGRAA